MLSIKEKKKTNVRVKQTNKEKREETMYLAFIVCFSEKKNTKNEKDCGKRMEGTLREKERERYRERKINQRKKLRTLILKTGSLLLKNRTMYFTNDH